MSGIKIDEWIREGIQSNRRDMTAVVGGRQHNL